MVKDKVYNDEFSQEVFELFEQKLYPEDVVRYLGGTKKEYSHMYQYWMDRKREYIEDGVRVEFVVKHEGYPEELLQGKVIKAMTNSVLVEIDSEIKDFRLRRDLNGKIVVSIKDILTL